MTDGWIERKPTPGEELGRMDEAMRDLTQQLTAERKRRDDTEEELYQERLAHTATVTRAEQAERERDTARKAYNSCRDEVTCQVERRERAEADNAALLEVLQRVGNEDICGWCGEAQQHRELCPVGLVIAQPHPGAALLEEMKALRADLAKLEESACGTCAPDEFATAEARKAAAALERMRALEETTTHASAELRHAYRPETRDWNLVARAIEMLERATTPKPETK